MLSHALRLMLVLTIPSSVGLALLSHPIIRLIYEHGAFTARDAEMAGGALFYYALGRCGYSAVKVVTDAFYALNDTMTPLRISVGAIASVHATQRWPPPLPAHVARGSSHGSVLVSSIFRMRARIATSSTPASQL